MYNFNQFLHKLYTRCPFIWSLSINFMEIYLLQKVSRVRRCLRFLILLEFKDTLRELLKSCFWLERNYWKYKWQKWNKFWFRWRPLMMLITASIETNVVSEIPNQLKRKMSLLHQGKEKQFQLQAKNLRKSKHFHIFFIQANLAITLRIYDLVLPGTSINSCWTLIVTLHQMKIISFFAWSAYEQHHLYLSIKFVLHKIKI